MALKDAPISFEQYRQNKGANTLKDLASAIKPDVAASSSHRLITFLTGIAEVNPQDLDVTITRNGALMATNYPNPDGTIPVAIREDVLTTPHSQMKHAKRIRLGIAVLEVAEKIVNHRERFSRKVAKAV